MVKYHVFKIIFIMCVAFSFLGCSKSRFGSTGSSSPADAITASPGGSETSGSSSSPQDESSQSQPSEGSGGDDSHQTNSSSSTDDDDDRSDSYDPFEGWSPEAIEAWEQFRDELKDGKKKKKWKKRKKKHHHRHGHHHHHHHHDHSCQCDNSSHNHDSHSCDNNDNPKDPDHIARKCKRLKNSGALRTMTKIIRFEDTKQETGRSQVCLFNQDGNLNKKDGFQRARYEQHRSFALPENAELCDLTMEMDKQSLKYDDMFYMTFNGVVIASNASNEVRKLQTSPLNVSEEQSLVPGYTYDWDTIVDSPFNNNGGTDYCLGADQLLAECQWPKTQQQGDFIFNYHPELLIALGARSNDNSHEIMFSITGDNDPNVDCYHEEFEFELKATYYIED